jgi:hypothetical protein
MQDDRSSPASPRRGRRRIRSLLAGHPPPATRCPILINIQNASDLQKYNEDLWRYTPWTPAGLVSLVGCSNINLRACPVPPVCPGRAFGSTGGSEGECRCMGVGGGRLRPGDPRRPAQLLYYSEKQLPAALLIAVAYRATGSVRVAFCYCDGQRLASSTCASLSERHAVTHRHLTRSDRAFAHTPPTRLSASEC